MAAAITLSLQPDYSHLCFWNSDSGRMTADNCVISRIASAPINDNHPLSIHSFLIDSITSLELFVALLGRTAVESWRLKLSYEL